MTNKQTAAWIRKWCADPTVNVFSWPTDGCGYDQHIKFVKHRNRRWTPEQAQKQTFIDFVMDYADRLEGKKRKGEE